MWLAGLSTPVKALVLLWHWLQSPLDGCAGSAHRERRCLAGRGARLEAAVLRARCQRQRRGGVGAQAHPHHAGVVATRWQPLVMPRWICADEGAGVAKPVPGAVFVAEAGTGSAGVLARWQASQGASVGMCAPGARGRRGRHADDGADARETRPCCRRAGGRCRRPLLMPTWLIRRAGELRAVAHRQAGRARAWAGMAGLAGAGGGQVVGREADDAEVGRRDGEGRGRRRAVATGTAGGLRGRVGVDVRQRRRITEKFGLRWQALHEAPGRVGMWLAGLAAAGRKAVVT